MKIKIIASIFTLASLPFLTGCYEDKGNYTYSEIEEVTCEFPSSIAGMQGADDIEFNPVVTSSINGVIGDDNKDYTYDCKILYSYKDEFGNNQPWTPINPDGTKKVKFFAGYPAGSYTLWYTVKNTKTDVKFDFKATCQVISTTSSGWMVLSNVGPERKVCMDVIFPHPSGGEKVASNVFGESCVPLNNGYKIMLNPSQYSEGDRIYVCTQSGTYRMNVNTLQYNENDNLKMFDFATNQPGEVVSWNAMYYSTAPRGNRMVVTDQGNAYSVISNGAGAGFEFPLNTDVAMADPTYKVSRFMGSSQVRSPGNSYVMVLYDITNKRFVGYNQAASGDAKRLLFVPKEDENSKFSFTTGMDIVDMESTLFSDGEVFTVLQDNAGKRHVYGIYGNGWSSNFVQDKVYECDAPDFHTATDYAFHSRYPFMFYCKDNKVYCYNMGTNAVVDVLTLPADEKISLVKFNTFQYHNFNLLIGYNDPEFREIPYRLIVGSSKGTEGSGAVRFYEISENGKMTPYKEFSGFSGEIADVTYHERR